MLHNGRDDSSCVSNELKVFGLGSGGEGALVCFN